jgi:hypothetical protein
MPPRPARVLWLTAIAVIALGMVGTCIGSMVYKGEQVQKWAATLLPADAMLLTAKALGGHYVIAYRTRNSVLSIALVHSHPWTVSASGIVKPEGFNMARGSFDPVHDQVQWFEFSIDPSFAGDLRVDALELRSEGVGTDSNKHSIGAFVVSWR